MNKINTPTSILEFGSTHIRLAVYEEKILNNNIFFEEKIDFTRDENNLEEQTVFNIIEKAEKNLGQHLNEIILLIDNPAIYSLDYCVKNNYGQKIISNDDIEHLIQDCENQIKINNKEKEILHTITSKIYFDDIEMRDLNNVSKKTKNVVIEIKFILIDKIIFNKLKNLLLKKHILLKKIFCVSYLKSLGLINKLSISGYNSFIDIGLKKSSIMIFKDDKLLFFNYSHIGGDHITKDISKILKIDYRTAESKKIKFYKSSGFRSFKNEDEFLKKIINSRLEEIIEILFLDCPFRKKNFFGSNLKIFFLGNGSKVLNENMLSFGSDFNFISEMTMLDEKSFDCCNSAAELNSANIKSTTQKSSISFENKGFFERLFEYFN